jgi:hypothetical protein
MTPAGASAVFVIHHDAGLRCKAATHSNAGLRLVQLKNRAEARASSVGFGLVGPVQQAGWLDAERQTIPV